MICQLSHFPHYKDHSKVSEGKQWYDFINEFDPQNEDFKPKLKDIWTIIFTSGTTGDPKRCCSYL